MGVLGFRRLTPKTCFKFDAKVQHFWCTNQEESLWEMRIEVGGERAVKREEWKVKSEQRSVNRGQWTEVSEQGSVNRGQWTGVSEQRLLIIDHWYWHEVFCVRCRGELQFALCCCVRFFLKFTRIANSPMFSIAPHVEGRITIRPYACVI